MDYDDNDTQSNNFDLAGESASKSSSVLRPYAFPRFDFDENLPGHLRFDSLVETESYLGIQGQEDNHWIEDYSRGSSVIEFSSSATDSCPLSRRHNVWSEATSSESVEMLLKSVGQEQLVPTESVINSSATFNDLDRLAKQMEAIRDKDNRSSEYSTAPDDTMPSDEQPINLPVLKDSIDGGASLSQVSLLPACDDSVHLGPNVSKDNFEIAATKSDLHAENDCGSSGLEVQCPGDESLKCQNVDDTADPILSSHGLGTSLVTLSTVSQQEVWDPSHQHSGGLRGGVDDSMDPLLSSSVEADTHMLKQPEDENSLPTAGTSLCDSKLDAGNFEEIVPSSHTDSATVSSIEELEFQLPKESEKASSCMSPSLPKTGEDNIVCTGEMVTGDNEISDTTIAVCTIEKHVPEVCPADRGLCSSPLQQRDSVTQIEHSVHNEKLGNLAENIQEKDNEVTASIDELSLVKEEAERPPVDNSGNSGNMDVGKLSDLPSASSEEPNREEAGASGNNISADASVCNREEPESPSVSRDVSVIEEDNINLAVNTSLDTNRAGSIDQDIKYPTGNMPSDSTMVDDVPPQTAANMDPDGKAPLHEKDSNLDPVKKDVNPESSIADVSELDRISSKISEDVNVSTLDRSDQEKIEVEKATSFGLVDHSVSQPQLSESSGKSPSGVKDIESGATENKCEELPKEFESDSSDHEKSLNIASSGEVDHAKSHEDALKVETGSSKAYKDETESSLGADSLEVACGSPTIINLGNRSEDEGCKHQEAMGSGVASVSAQPDQCISQGPTSKDNSEDDSSFTFKVNSLPEAAEGGKGNNWTPLSKVETYNSHTVVEQTVVQVPTSAAIESTDASVPHQAMSSGPVAQFDHLEGTPVTLLQETPDQIPNASGGVLIGEMSKGASGRRVRRASGKGTGKEGSSRLNSQKETTPIKSSFKVEKLPSASPTMSGISLPTSNSSASPSNLAFPQPFSDAQQVQLRAQIFVYGSLIQGSAPDEGYMVSAFGPTDGGMWESVWRAAVERVRNQKSISNLATPVHSPGVRTPEAATKQGSHQSKILPSPSDRGGIKDSPLPILNPMMPLSSPLWGHPTSQGSSQSRGMQRGTILDFQPPVSPMHPFQTPPIQGFIGSTAWPSSQTTFPPSPWASHKAKLSTSASFTPVTFTEPVRLSSAKDSPLLPSSGVKNVSTNPMAHLGNPNMVFAGFQSSYPSQTMGVSSPPPSSAEPKPRRRKKSQASNDGSQYSFISQALPEPVGASPAVISTLSPIAATLPVSHVPPSPTVISTLPPIAATLPVSHVPPSPTVISTLSPIAATLPVSHVPPSPTVVTPAGSVSPITATSQPKMGSLDPRKNSVCSEETLKKVSEAKLQAEEAASLAASALSHSESVWSGLSKQKELVTSSEAEAKLSSAAVAVAAAASVARAAAAAARVASNAAFQAKLMAEEALLPSEMQVAGEVDGYGQPGSVLVAAREAAKKRIEVATAAAKQAENLEAIVKAAELAEQAVSQAGRIVSMGDPLPLKDLITAGPEGYWKLQKNPPVEHVLKSDNKNKEQMNVSVSETEGGSSVVRIVESSEHRVQVADMSSGSLVDPVAADDIPQSYGSVKKDGHESHNISHADESGGIGPSSETDSGTGTTQRDHEDLDLTIGTRIRKGSLVEVYRKDGKLKPAWFSANVLDVEDGKALVSYLSLGSDDSNNLEEWVALEGEDDEAPRVRFAPESSLDSHGTRKRRRAAMDYTWSVGDRVDVQYQDCWWEGLVTEKSEKDETTLTVHFPARGETSAVRSWQLRPSRCWKDGKWVEWSRLSGGQDKERDMPVEKRQKFGSPFEFPKKTEKLPKILESSVQKAEPKRMEKLPAVSSLALSAGDKVFNVGKNTGSRQPGEGQRTVRAGLQKEGSKVVFGVPKPGKKRKFMEVSKHYSSGSGNVAAARERDDKKKGNNNNNNNDSVKFTKYLMPQSTGAAAGAGAGHPAAPTRGVKVFSRSDFRGKQTAAGSRPLISRKPPNTPSVAHKTPAAAAPRSTVRGEKSSKVVKKLDNFTDPRIDDDDDDEGSDLQQQQHDDVSHGSCGSEEVKEEGPLSSLFPSQLEKLSSIRGDRAFNAKATDKSARKQVGAGPSSSSSNVVVFNAKATDKAAAGGEQPRRSGRRIQPTHRLLEGLQSQLIMPKATTVSHDRSHKSQNKSTTTPKWK